MQRLVFALCLAAILAPGPSAPAASVGASLAETPRDDRDEYAVKAGVVTHFVRYSSWPASAFDSPQAPVVVAVLGTNPFGKTLAQALAAVKNGERPIEVRHLERWRDLREVHVLFVARDAERFMKTVRERVGDRPVILIGDRREFAVESGAVGVFLKDRRIAFAACRQELTRLRALELTISSEVLKLAELVDRVAPPEEQE